MKIKIGETRTLIETTNEVTLSDVFSGVGIETNAGLFGIAQRDGGIEVMLDGKTVWVSNKSLGGEVVWKAAKEQADALVGVDTPEAAFRRGQKAAWEAIKHWLLNNEGDPRPVVLEELCTQHGYQPPTPPKPTKTLEEMKAENESLRLCFESAAQQRDALLKYWVHGEEQRDARDAIQKIHDKNMAAAGRPA